MQGDGGGWGLGNSIKVSPTEPAMESEDGHVSRGRKEKHVQRINKLVKHRHTHSHM